MPRGGARKMFWNQTGGFNKTVNVLTATALLTGTPLWTDGGQPGVGVPGKHLQPPQHHWGSPRPARVCFLV